MMMTRNNMLSRAIQWIALLSLALCSCWLLSSPVHAASAGRIYGQLLDGSKKNAPLAGQTVILQMAQGSNSKDLASVVTDGQGAYAFANLATDKSISYALYIRYQGAQYLSNIVSLDSKSVQRVNLTVYEATSSTANMAVVRATILLHKPDVQRGIISVSELYIFRNLDARTYVGSLDASHGMPNALRFSLPHTATNVALGKGFDSYQAIEVDRGIATNAAVPPGDSQFVFTFDMPYTMSNYDFDYTVVYPTVQLGFLIPPEIAVSSDTLTAQKATNSQQANYTLYQANALLADKEVHLELAGLPVLNPLANTPATAAGPDTSWVIIGLLAMLAIVIVTWLVYRSAQRPAPTASKKKRVQQKRAQRQQKSTDAATRVEKDVDKEQALLQELLELDKAFEAGTLSKAVYQERRAKTKARLRAVMREKVTP